MKKRVDGRAAVTDFLASGAFASALAGSSIAIGILALPIHNTIGWAGLIAPLVVQIVLCGLSVWARRETLVSTALLPISLLLFIGWACVSVLWSEHRWVTIASLCYLLAFSILGAYVALVRDTIQVIRAYGDAIRFALVGSLVLEVLSGLLIDAPIRFLGIAGNLANGGPISGLLANRNDLGLLAVIGALSFVLEWRTRSTTRGLAIFSLALAGLTLLLTRSSIGWGTALVSALVLGALYLIRRVSPARRQYWQWGAATLAVVGAITAWALRSPIVSALSATGELNYRLQLWREVLTLVEIHPVEGWGWVGLWNTEVAPYVLFGTGSGRPSTSAVNAYLDVWFQLGIIGLALFLCMIGLAFVRSWLLASRQRSVLYTWPAVVVAALVTASLAESGILIEFGWMTLVICCCIASQKLSWRAAFRRPLEPEPL